MTRLSVRFLLSSFSRVTCAATFTVFSLVATLPASAQESDLSEDVFDQTQSVEQELLKLPAPPPASRLKKIGSFKPSFYWIALEEKDGQPRNQRLYDVDGNHMVSVSENFFKKLKMEGTGRMLDGRVINFKARIVLPDGSKEIRYRWCGDEAPYGFGWEDIPLVPFKSLAVDPTVVPIGTKLYVPDARGAKLPDGTIHDGMFVARDIGDAIQEKRIDVFTSFGDQSVVFTRVGMSHMKPVDVYIVK